MYKTTPETDPNSDSKKSSKLSKPPTESSTRDPSSTVFTDGGFLPPVASIHATSDRHKTRLQLKIKLFIYIYQFLQLSVLTLKTLLIFINRDSAKLMTIYLFKAADALISLLFAVVVCCLLREGALTFRKSLLGFFLQVLVLAESCAVYFFLREDEKECIEENIFETDEERNKHFKKLRVLIIIQIAIDIVGTIFFIYTACKLKRVRDRLENRKGSLNYSIMDKDPWDNDKRRSV